VGLLLSKEKVAGEQENGLPNPASSRLGFHARKPLRLVEDIGKMLSSTYGAVGQPNWFCDG
jgi:hypothetical protein